MKNNSTIERLHKATCERQENGYKDPVTGFYVLSAYYLKNRGNCCGAGCRHCPFDAEEQQRAGRPTITNPPSTNNPKQSKQN